jgi:predicted ester cyclase
MPSEPSAVVHAVVRDLLNGTDEARGAQLVASTFQNHSPWFDHPPTLEGWLMSIRAWRLAFPDLVCSQVRLVCEADLVAYQGAWRGTHCGAFGAIEPTGRVVEVGEHRMFRVRNGLVMEHWQEQDTAGLLRQLGRGEVAAQAATS